MDYIDFKKWQKRFDQLIQESENILIIGHINPDPDAIASCLAIDYYLKDKFPQKSSSVLLYPPWPAWLSEFVHQKTNLIQKPKKLKAKPDLLIFVDGDSLDRFFPGNNFSFNGAKRIRIDHHITGGKGFDFSLVDKKAAATAQIVAELLFSKQKPLDKKVAQLLLIGILGDTGSFRYISPRNCHFLNTVSWLVERGRADIESLLNRLEMIEKKELELIGLLIKNTRFVNSRKVPPFIYSFLSELVLKKGFAEKFVKEAKYRYLFFFVRRIRGYPWGFVLTPQGKGVFNISFRSENGGPNVARLAEKYFSGGGHARAAGGMIESSKGAQEACRKVIEKIRKAKF